MNDLAFVTLYLDTYGLLAYAVLVVLNLNNHDLSID
jgi:hypothetical protein